MMTGPWTEERDEQLKALRAEGLSFGLIANIMGISRNALIGRAGRIGLNGQPTRSLRRGPHRIDHPQWQRKPRKARASPAARPEIVRVLPVPIGEKTELAPEIFKDPKPLRNLDEGQCRWPGVGAGADMLFCAAPTLQDRSYCWHHCFIAYRDFPEPPKCESVEPSEAAA